MFDRISEGRWWDRPWSLVDGCTPVSPGCNHCWSAAMTHRFNRPEGAHLTSQGKFVGKIIARGDRLDLPLKTKKPTAWAVWNDLFHEDVPDDFIDNVYSYMHGVDRHIYLILTKRPKRALEFYQRSTLPGYKKPHIWLGVTAENQGMANLRIPILLQIPAAVRFVSAEPLLGPVDFNQVICADGDHLGPSLFNHGAGAGLDLVIVGGESGPGARPMHPGWARSLRDQCLGTKVAFFFKQWGEWYPNWSEMTRPDLSFTQKHMMIDDLLMCRVGQKAAGRILDGKEYNGLPRL